MRGPCWGATRLAWRGVERVYVRDAAAPACGGEFGDYGVRLAAAGAPAGRAAPTFTVYLPTARWEGSSASKAALPPAPMLAVLQRLCAARGCRVGQPHAAAAGPPAAAARGAAASPLHASRPPAPPQLPGEAEALYREAGLRSFLAVAIGPQGAPFGALLAARREPGGFDDAWCAAPDGGGARRAAPRRAASSCPVPQPACRSRPLSPPPRRRLAGPRRGPSPLPSACCAT
jgi:hypothetical protein